MSEYLQQRSRDSDDHEETFLYGPSPPRPLPRAYRPRSCTSETIPFADAEFFSNGSAKHSSLDRRRDFTFHVPPPPPPPPSLTIASEDATSLNNILDAFDDLEQAQDSDSMATTGSLDDSEDEMDILTELPMGKWSAVKSGVSMRGDNGARVDASASARQEPSGHGTARGDTSGAPLLNSQVSRAMHNKYSLFTCGTILQLVRSYP